MTAQLDTLKDFGVGEIQARRLLLSLSQKFRGEDDVILTVGRIFNTVHRGKGENEPRSCSSVDDSSKVRRTGEGHAGLRDLG